MTLFTLFTRITLTLTFVLWVITVYYWLRHAIRRQKLSDDRQMIIQSPTKGKPRKVKWDDESEADDE
tara:strand:+ start:1043 stop:1243 length:201 start_codon:yes stop_codon:yes gene_type:complete